MATNRWKYVGQTNGGSYIYVEYNNRKTKIVTGKYIYIYNGVYPFINYDYSKRFRK